MYLLCNLSTIQTCTSWDGVSMVSQTSWCVHAEGIYNPPSQAARAKQWFAAECLPVHIQCQWTLSLHKYRWQHSWKNFGLPAIFSILKKPYQWGRKELDWPQSSTILSDWHQFKTRRQTFAVICLRNHESDCIIRYTSSGPLIASAYSTWVGNHW